MQRQIKLIVSSYWLLVISYQCLVISYSKTEYADPRLLYINRGYNRERILRLRLISG